MSNNKFPAKKKKKETAEDVGVLVSKCNDMERELGTVSQCACACKCVCVCVKRLYKTNHIFDSHTISKCSLNLYDKITK